jgi:two-component system sensor histidine kinase KdpD
VGKTYRMLTEAHELRRRGVDVVIGFVEPHGRAETEAQIGDLEVIPRRRIDYRGVELEEMDVDAVLARRPEVAIVDELAHTNVPGVSHRKRWEDVLQLLDNGINVISAVNIQHLESLNDVVARTLGITVRETVPDWVPLLATETVMVDLTPEALQNRLKRGDVYSTEKVNQALGNFFRAGNLIALRELALRQVAEHVDRSLGSYMDAKAIEDNWAVRERLAVCISSNPAGQYVIARAARMARRLDAECYVVYVELKAGETPENQRSLAANLQFAQDLGAIVVRAKGRSVAHAVAELVREKRITQVIFGRTAVKGWRRFLYLTAVHRFLREAPAVDVHIVTHEGDSANR